MHSRDLCKLYLLVLLTCIEGSKFIQRAFHVDMYFNSWLVPLMVAVTASLAQWDF